MDKKIKINTDYQLLNKYIQGDVFSGNKLFLDAYQTVKSFISYKLRNNNNFTEEDKEDILSESFCRAFDKCYEFREGKSFSSYVNGFANNIIKEKIKEKIKESSLGISSFEDLDYDFDKDADNISWIGKDPLDILIAKENVERIENALNQLPKDYQDVIRLRYINGMKTTEIAKFSGKTPEAVRSMCRRAVKKFKEIY